jgi:Hydroxymethylpyrimidine/phosphomethylpyrimidine kinase
MENVLTIAGSDSLAGGGLQADLKTFEELDTFGLSAVTSLVTIVPQHLHVTPMTAPVVAQQLTSILTQVPIRAAKTGLLGDAEVIHTVATQLAVAAVPLVVDPRFGLQGRSDGAQSRRTCAAKNRPVTVSHGGHAQFSGSGTT